MSAILVPGTEEYLKARIEAFKKAGLSTEAEEAELIRIAKRHSMTKDPINQALQALIGSSGIDENQAKTSLFYAVATHLLPDKLDIMPALAIIGPSGTGKTSLMKQLERMVKDPKWLNAKSSPSLRDNLHGTITALIEEADKVDEDFISNRYARETSHVLYKVEAETGWITKTAEIFGATILHRRVPFKDLAVKSRSITIQTKYKPGHYEIADVRREDIMEIANEVTQTFETSDRVRDSWRPLQIVAMTVCDKDWLEYSESEIQKDANSLLASQNYEPEQALLIALQEAMVTKSGIEMDVLVSDLKRALKYEFDLTLKSIQIQQICQNLGFKVTTTSNYPRVKADRELLEKLLGEYKLKN